MALKITTNTELTHDEKISKTKQEIATILLMLHSHIAQGLATVESLILKNPYELTMSEIRDSYGEDVASLDAIGEKAKELLAMVDVQ